MSKPLVGILTCQNTKQDCYCPAVMCLQNLRESKGAFAVYRERGGAELLGLVTCDGCPTLAAPDRIVKRVKGLVDLGVEAIHLSTCLALVCPYRNKYASLLQKTFPGVEVIMGTHLDEGVPVAAATELFQGLVHGLIAPVPEKTMADVALELYPDVFGKRSAGPSPCCGTPTDRT